MIELGRVFADDEVAALYRYRAPYPPEVFAILEDLIVEPRVVLDVGAGTGALAREIAPRVARVDAVDPSAAMIAQGRAMPGGSDAKIRWITGRAEEAPLDPPYGLITAGASLHWMEHAVVLPRFRASLAPEGFVAVVDIEPVYERGALADTILAIIRRYSPVKNRIETSEMLKTLTDRGLFALDGQKRTAPVPWEQSIDDALRSLHSTSTLSRVTLGARVEEFDGEMRSAYALHGVERAHSEICGYVAWGRPR
jgi:SAM-dependent methyltransferase